MPNAILLLSSLLLTPAVGPGDLNDFRQTLLDAKSLTATVTTQVIGGGATSTEIALSKPNLAKISGNGKTIVADGTTITTLDLAQKTFVKQPQTADALNALFTTNETLLFGSFFDAKSLWNPKIVRTFGPVNRKGASVNGVEIALNAEGTKKLTVYINPTDKLARQAEFTVGSETKILEAKDLAINGDVVASLFKFTAPAGVKEISLSDLNADKWYSNLEEAKKIAASTNKKIFVDFMAEWCGPCKLLDKEVFQTDKFKKLSSKFVFLKIDVDKQPDVSKAYNIEAMPTQMVLAADGSVLKKTVGYGGPDPFYNFLSGF
jgi:outer membrane lipoprotein-sorting protein